MDNMNIFGVYEVSDDISNHENESRIINAEKYKKYIDNHISNVIKAYNELIKNEWINNSYNRDIKEGLIALKSIIPNHDASKYSDAEFDAYRAWFYPINDEEKENAREDFEMAKKHHYAENDHHPEHWVDENGNPVDMPLVAILHLICDWEAMSYNKEGPHLTTMEFWKQTKESKWVNIMTPNTIKTLERLFKLIYYKE